MPSSRFSRNSVPFHTPSRSSPSQRSDELSQAPSAMSTGRLASPSRHDSNRGEIAAAADDLHVYAVEALPQRRRAFEALPHTGNVVSPAVSEEHIHITIAVYVRRVHGGGPQEKRGDGAFHPVGAASVQVLPPGDLLSNTRRTDHIETHALSEFTLDVADAPPGTMCSGVTATLIGKDALTAGCHWLCQ